MCIYPNNFEIQDSACREVTEFKVVNCSCINDIPTIRGGLHEIAVLVILGWHPASPYLLRPCSRNSIFIHINKKC